MVQGGEKKEISHDVIEQKHYKNSEDKAGYNDYLMFVQLKLQPDSFQVIQINEKEDQPDSQDSMESNTKLDVLGISEDG